MDEYIKQSIDSRKNALSASYEINAEMQQKIDKLFAEIEKLGTSCKDVGEFETEFQKSPLNQKYLDLFTEVATNSQAKVAASKKSKAGVGEYLAGSMAIGIAEDAVDRAATSVLPTRASINQKVSDTARRTPVLGDALDLGQKASYAAHLGKLFKGRKKKDEK